VKRIDAEIEALATLSPAQLRERWSGLSAGPAPTVPEGLLRRLVAQQLQEKKLGGLPAMLRRELDRLGSDTPIGSKAPSPPPPLTPGTRLVREWNGQTISVEVRETGFEWNGKNWRSLSEIARAVTGAHWSGPRFFGVRRHG